MGQPQLTLDYKGFTICGAAAPVHNDVRLYFAEGTVLLLRPNQVLLQVDRFTDRLLTQDDFSI